MYTGQNNLPCTVPTGVTAVAAAMSVQTGYTNTITVQGTLAPSSLTQKNGTITISSGGNLNWVAGTVGPSAELDVLSGGTLNITTTAAHNVAGGTIIVAGAANRTGVQNETASINITNQGDFNLQSGGVLTASANTTESITGDGSGLFFNQGGTVSVGSGGSLNISTPSQSQLGSFTASAATSFIVFNAAATWDDGTAVTGAGTITSNGNVTLGGTVTEQVGTNLNLNGLCTLSGPGTLQINGTCNSSASFQGGGTVIVEPGALWNIRGASINGFTFINDGTADWLGGFITFPAGNITNNGSFEARCPF